jgi:hypothetical protein
MAAPTRGLQFSVTFWAESARGFDLADVRRWIGAPTLHQRSLSDPLAFDPIGRRMLAGMRHRWLVAVVGVIALVTVLAGCRSFQTESEPDRAESIVVPGGKCDISWWLAPLVEDVPEKAQETAARALATADVGADEWEEWHASLDGDPDNDSANPVRIYGAAYLEAVRAEVRDALNAVGYPDTTRIIEVYSDLSCAES